MFRVAKLRGPNRFPHPKDVVVEKFPLEIEQEPSALRKGEIFGGRGKGWMWLMDVGGRGKRN